VQQIEDTVDGEGALVKKFIGFVKEFWLEIVAPWIVALILFWIIFQGESILWDVGKIWGKK
jgi:hypothetical protein